MYYAWFFLNLLKAFPTYLTFVRIIFNCIVFNHTFLSSQIKIHLKFRKGKTEVITREATNPSPLTKTYISIRNSCLYHKNKLPTRIVDGPFLKCKAFQIQCSWYCHGYTSCPQTGHAWKTIIDTISSLSFDSL